MGEGRLELRGGARRDQAFALGAARLRFFGFDEPSIRGLRAKARAIRISDHELRSHVVEGALVDKLEPLTDGKFRGGVFSADGASIEFAQISRAGEGVVFGNVPGPQGIQRRHIAGDAIFGGVLFSGYGHLILESLSRLWYARDSGLPIVFCCLSEKAGGVSLLVELAESLGIERHRIMLLADLPFVIA